MRPDDRSPDVTDPEQSGYSLANLAEIMFPCLDAAEVRTLVEVGAYRGDLTREVLAWAAGRSASVTAIEPEPPTELLQLSEEHPELELIRESSHHALGPARRELATWPQGRLLRARADPRGASPAPGPQRRSRPRRAGRSRRRTQLRVGGATGGWSSQRRPERDRGLRRPPRRP